MRFVNRPVFLPMTPGWVARKAGKPVVAACQSLLSRIEVCITFQQIERNPSSQGWNPSSSFRACRRSSPILLAKSNDHRLLFGLSSVVFTRPHFSLPGILERTHLILIAV